MSGPIWTTEPHDGRLDERPLTPGDPGQGAAPFLGPHPEGSEPIDPDSAQPVWGDARAKAKAKKARDKANAGPRKRPAWKFPALATLRGWLPSLGGERREILPDAPHDAANPAQPDGPTPPATASPPPAPGKRSRGRGAFLGLNETRVGIAAVVSFAVMVAVFVVHKGWAGTRTPPSVAIQKPAQIRADAGPKSGTTGAKPTSNTPPLPALPEPGPLSEPTPPVPSAPPVKVAGAHRQGEPNEPLISESDRAQSLTLASAAPLAPPPELPHAGLTDPVPPKAEEKPNAEGKPKVEEKAPEVPAIPPPTPATVSDGTPPLPGLPPAFGPPPAPKSGDPPVMPDLAPNPVITDAPAQAPSPDPAPVAPPAKPSAPETPPPPQEPPAIAPDLPAAPAPAPAPPADVAPPRPTAKPPTLEIVPSATAPVAATAATAEALGPGWVTVKSGGGRRSVAVPEPSGGVGPAPAVGFPVDGPRPVEDRGAVDQVVPVLHRVQRGENFWSISKRYYSSHRYYLALHAANRRQVPDITELYVGTVIRIPPPEALDRSLIVPPGRAQANDGPAVSRASRRGEAGDEIVLARPVRPLLPRDEADAPAEPSRPTYRVRANETLRSIARDTLGDGRHYKEIYNLNRDIVDDPKAVLVPDTTLTLPEDAVVGRRGK